ncbi:MAG TPA: hypothetical protein VD766_02580 [Solirubrobacterales bacterium]|nr:hypothetical protein [Solirubrobacterales bacterium]
MEKQLDALVQSLLYEGYALYPYTPGATKNATPTPFGIVYPPAYAEGNAATFDHLRVDCVLHVAEGAKVRGTVRFLQTAGDRHEGEARQLEVPPTPLADLADGGVVQKFEFEGEQPIQGRFRLRADEAGEGLARVRMCVHNSTPVENGAEMKRGEALKASLISTHVVIETTAGRFASPLERSGPAGEAVAQCDSINSFPVLADPEDRAILGAAIVLPDHPALSPHSLGNLFDNTEIEEALILHVKALSDAEREDIEKQDPAVRKMIAKAEGTTDEDLMRLHGLMRPSDVLDGVEDPGPPPEPGHPNPGEPEMEVARGTIQKGGKVILHPGAASRDPMDTMLAGRTATVERIYRDMDDKIHVGVTIDGDASQDLFRETGRYIFFKGDEVEPVRRSEAKPSPGEEPANGS